MVIRENGQYKMWYRGWSPYNDFDAFGYATSSDGINWTKDTLNNPVMVPSSDAWQAYGFTSPHVLPFEGGYKMWYTGWTANWSSSNIGYATSDDGITWTPDTVNNPVLTKGSTGQWDDRHLEFNQVLFIDNVYHMWYTGARSGESQSQTGWATSADGIHWNKHNDTTTTSTLYLDSDPVLGRGSTGQWDEDRLSQGTVMLEDDTLRMWYSGFRQPYAENLQSIGHATAPYEGITGLFEFGDVVVPGDYVLRQNYPNPFNPVTKIEFTLPKSEYVELKVYNILGKEVATLVSKNLNHGNHIYQFDGSMLASGIYYYKIEVGDPARRTGQFQDVKKMILIK